MEPAPFFNCRRRPRRGSLEGNGAFLLQFLQYLRICTHRERDFRSSGQSLHHDLCLVWRDWRGLRIVAASRRGRGLDAEGPSQAEPTAAGFIYLA